MLANLYGWLEHQIGTRPIAELDGAALERRRMHVLFAIALFKLLNFFGGTWDIQWHVVIGRDNLFIPPHLLVLVAFGGGILLAWAWICYETFILQGNPHARHAVKVGMFAAPLSFYGVFLGYAAALLSGLFDEWWHRMFGIDSTLWSPPHLCIMASTMFVDYNLMLGIASAARRLGYRFEWRSPFLWGLALTGAYLFESVNFQMSQAFLEAYRVGGAGWVGLLFPILVGALFPMPMLALIKIATRFWVAWLVFVVAFFLQFLGIEIAAAGFAILQPGSQIADFVRLNPNSVIATITRFMAEIGFFGWLGLQEYTLALSAVPLGLVALLDRWTWARRHPLLAAPVYSTSLVIVSFAWFKQMPVLSHYAVALPDVLLGVAVSACIGLGLGYIGLRLGSIVPNASSSPKFGE